MAKAKNISFLGLMNVKLGGFIYGNGANYSNNYKGQKNWAEAKQKCSDATPQSDDMKHLQEHGFTQPKIFFTSNLIKAVVNDYQAVIEDNKHATFLDIHGEPDTESSKDFVARYIIKNPLKSMPAVQKLFTKEFTDMIRSYYQSDFKLHAVNSWRTAHVSDEVLAKIYPDAPYSLFWHTDGHTVDTTKFFMVLSEVSEEHGPLHFLSKQRTKELIKKGFLNRFMSIGMKDEIESVDLHKLTGKTGTAAFCNTPICLHKAGVPAKGKTRDILEFQFESSQTPFELSEFMQKLQ